MISPASFWGGGFNSSTVVREQMNVVNLAFGGFYGGANTGFSFTLAGVTPSKAA